MASRYQMLDRTAKCPGIRNFRNKCSRSRVTRDPLLTHPLFRVINCIKFAELTIQDKKKIYIYVYSASFTITNNYVITTRGLQYSQKTKTMRMETQIIMYFLGLSVLGVTACFLIIASTSASNTVANTV